MSAAISIARTHPRFRACLKTRRRLAVSIIRSRFFFISFLFHISAIALLGTLVVHKGQRQDHHGSIFRCGGGDASGGIFTAPPAGFPSAPPAASRSQAWKPSKVRLASAALSSDSALGRIALARVSSDFNLTPPGIPSTVDCAELLDQVKKGSFGSTEGGDGLPGDGHGKGMGGHEVNFFGIKSRAEKIAILIDASTSMLFPNKGGIEGYGRVKEEVARLIRELPENSLFNMILFCDRVYVFNKEGLVPMTGASRKQATEWIQPLHDAEVPLIKNSFSSTSLAEFDSWCYSPSERDLPSWGGGTRIDIALLATFEQRPDSIFIISDGQPEIAGWTPSRVLQKVSQWQWEFYRKASLKLPRVHVVSYEADSKGDAFLRNLAGQNHGKFLRIKGFRNHRIADLRKF